MISLLPLLRGSRPIRRRSPTVSLWFIASITGLTANPTYGETAQIGVELTAQTSSFSAGSPASITYQWRTPAGALNGATAQTYTPVAGDDLETLYCEISADGYPTRATPAYIVRQAPPVAANALPDQLLTNGTGDQSFDVSGDFSGDDLSYTISGATGATIDALTGLVTQPTTTQLTSAIAIVSATNSGGEATSGYSVTVSDGSGVLEATLAYNPSKANYYFAGQVFENLAKAMRPWFNGDGGLTETTYQNANGVYTSIPPGSTWVRSALNFENYPDTAYQTNYTLEYEGEGTLAIGNAGSDNVTYVSADASGGTATFDVTGGSVQIDFTAIPDPLNPPKVIKVYRTADTAQLALIDAGNVFTSEYIAHLRPNNRALYMLRCMNLMLINDSTVRDIADYPTPDHATYTSGVPFEYICDLINEIGCRPWFVMPAQATPELVRHFAGIAVSKFTPAQLAETRIEGGGNETFNVNFDAFHYHTYMSARKWGTVKTGVAVVEGATTITFPDATGINVGDIVSYEYLRGHRHADVTNVTGNVVTIDRGFQFPDGTYEIAVGGLWKFDHYNLAATTHINEWESVAGPSIRVAATLTASTAATANILDAPYLQTQSPSEWTDGRAFFDKLAITTYYNASSLRDVDKRAEFLAFLDANGVAAARQLILDQLLSTDPGEGLGETEAFLKAQLDEIAGDGIDLDPYEGGDHSITGLGTSADDTRLWEFHRDFIYSAEYAPVVARHYDLSKGYVAGPHMQYSTVVVPGPAGLWGLHRWLGDNNPRAQALHALALNDTPWWDDAYAPTARLDLPNSIDADTATTLAVDTSSWFSLNAATLTLSNAPAGVELNGSFLSIDIDVQGSYSFDITAATATGNQTTFTIAVEVAYVAPIVVPDPDFEDDFADASKISLQGNASVSGGALICNEPTSDASANLTDFQTAVRAEDPQQYAITFQYVCYAAPDPLAADASTYEPETNASIYRNNFELNPSRIRLWNEEGSGVFYNFASPLILNDNVPHRVTVVMNNTTGTGTIYLDGAVHHVIDYEDATPRLWANGGAIRLRNHTNNSGNARMEFRDFKAWWQMLDGDQVLALN